MFLTVLEAQKKECPMLLNHEHCIAEACMGWRVEFVFDSRVNKRVPMGYCGHAGKPVKESPWPEMIQEDEPASKIARFVGKN